MLPLQVIRLAIQDNWINSLAYYCQLKKVHKNSLFYAYSLRKVAQTIKCSPTTLRHHLQILESRGLVSYSGGNLMLTGTNKLKKEYNSKLIPVKHSANKSDQVALIRFTLIKRNMAYQVIGYEFGNKALKFLKEGRCKGMKTKTMNKLTTGKTVQTLESYRHPNFMLSNKSFGRIVNRSQRTGKNLQKKLNQLKMIKSSKNIIKVSNCKKIDLRTFNELALPAKTFVSGNGTLYLRLPNSLVLKKERRIVCDTKSNSKI